VAERGPVSIRKRASTANLNRKETMFPYEEENLEQQIQHLGRNLSNAELLEVGAAKRVLRDGLSGFEELLKKLPANDRQAALRLYLDRIRYVTFSFNLSVLKMTVKARSRGFSSRKEMQEALSRAKKDFDDLARLYKLL
jgi:hypothetical protein